MTSEKWKFLPENQREWVDRCIACHRAYHIFIFVENVPTQRGCEAFTRYTKNQKPINEDGLISDLEAYDFNGVSIETEEIKCDALNAWTKHIFYASSNFISAQVWCHCLSFQITEVETEFVFSFELSQHTIKCQWKRISALSFLLRLRTIAFQSHAKIKLKFFRVFIIICPIFFN